jgi:alkanesulfonate monooxygenase SsuD/methylene tetrahydromethanopterin reductase-like flavin-dependent oxidoreductase (luciferase family)
MTTSRAPVFAFQVAPVSGGAESDKFLYDSALEDARLGHALGFSVAWIIEHHFTDYYPTPNPLVMLSHIAAACPGLGLGTSVMVLPWYNPLRFAEDVAMLQTLSKADLHIGIGRGTAKLEYDAFGVDMTEARERFRESWEIIRTALKGEPFSYKGKYLSVDKELLLRPVLSGRKPNFYGAIGSPQSAAIMADLDLAPIGLAQFPERILRSVMDNWRARRVELGRSPAAEVPILVQCYIADSDEEARAQARQYLPLYFKKQVEHYEILKDPWKDTEGYEQFSRMFSTLLKLSNSTDIDAFLDMNAIGSPATVERRIRELMDIGFNHFLMTNSTPGVPKHVRHSMLKRLASDVMPRFSSRSKAA